MCQRNVRDGGRQRRDPKGQRVFERPSPAYYDDQVVAVVQNSSLFDGIDDMKGTTFGTMSGADAKMREYRELLGVDNVLIVRRDGSVVARAQKTEADFSHARFNYLRESLSTGESSRAVEIDLPDRAWLYRYYAAKIDDDTMAVIEQSPVELDELDAATSSTASVLKNITVGQDGYVFALSAQTYCRRCSPCPRSRWP